MGLTRNQRAVDVKHNRDRFLHQSCLCAGEAGILYLSFRDDAVTTKDLDQLSVSTIRTLAMDAVQAANSGHPGTAMAMAPVLYCLWQRFLRPTSCCWRPGVKWRFVCRPTRC